MTIATDGQVRASAKDLGAEQLDVTKWPIFGTGKLKNVYDATQSTSYFVTSWSKHKKEAAAFLIYLTLAAQIEARGTPRRALRRPTTASTPRITGRSTRAYSSTRRASRSGSRTSSRRRST